MLLLGGLELLDELERRRFLRRDLLLEKRPRVTKGSGGGVQTGNYRSTY